MIDIVICAMTESDLSQVLSLETVSYSRPWSTSHFLHELASPHSFPLSAFDFEGKLAGYICPMVVLDEGHILNVAVRAESRGTGIGKLLMKRALRECRERGAAFVSLEVRPSNASAIALYRKLGFEETGRRKNYYENGEDALLMEYIFRNSEESCNAM